jgi:hypothetical protein
MSRAFLLLVVVVVCVFGVSLGASFQELHKKIVTNQRENQQRWIFKQVATTANLGTVGFATLKFFQGSAICSGAVTSGEVHGTGTCFSDGTGSQANIVIGSTAGPIVQINSTKYSDTACTFPKSFVIHTGSSNCLSSGTTSQIGFFSTSFPSLSSTFGAGTFSA